MDTIVERPTRREGDGPRPCDGLVLAAFPARAAVLDANDTSRLAAINDAIQSFEDDVGSALHNLPPDAADQSNPMPMWS